MNFIKITLKYTLYLAILGIGVAIGSVVLEQMPIIGILWITGVIAGIILTIKELIKETKEKSPEHWIADSIIPILIGGIIFFFAIAFIGFSVIR